MQGKMGRKGVSSSPRSRLAFVPLLVHMSTLSFSAISLSLIFFYAERGCAGDDGKREKEKEQSKFDRISGPAQA